MVSRVVVSEEFLLGFSAIHVLKEPGTERPVRNRGVPAGFRPDLPVLTGIFTGTKTSPFCSGFASGTGRSGRSGRNGTELTTLVERSVRKMAAKEEIRIGREGEEEEEHVYRISTDKEWEELQRNGSCFGGQLDKSSGFIHLSKLDQVMSTVKNFFLNTKVDLYLLQIDAKKLGDGLIYEVVDGTNSFPHFYGPSRSFSPLPLDVVTKAEKLVLADGQFSCSLLN